MAIMTASAGTTLHVTSDEVDLSNPESLKRAKWVRVDLAAKANCEKKKKERK